MFSVSAVPFPVTVSAPDLWCSCGTYLTSNTDRASQPSLPGRVYTTAQLSWQRRGTHDIIPQKLCLSPPCVSTGALLCVMLIRVALLTSPLKGLKELDWPGWRAATPLFMCYTPWSCAASGIWERRLSLNLSLGLRCKMRVLAGWP